MSDFEIMGTPPTNANIPKKLTLPVTNEIKKTNIDKTSNS